MPNIDPLGRCITRRTDRALDRHAADLPQAADRIHNARMKLLLTIDRLRTALINDDDLPHTGSCRKGHLAWLRTRVRIGRADAELDRTFGPGQLRLNHASAGIHDDPAHGFYVLEPAAAKAASGD